jgi:hypothetical protein
MSTTRNRNKSARKPFEPDPTRRPPIVIKMKSTSVFTPGSTAHANARIVRALSVAKNLTPKPCKKPRMAGGSRKYTQGTRAYWRLRNSGYGDKKCRVRGWTPTTLAFRYAGHLSERASAAHEAQVAAAKRSRMAAKSPIARAFGAIRGVLRRG